MNRLTLAYSTCPNDTFIFEALTHGRLAGCPFRFDVTLADIKDLNRMARAGGPDVVKVSYYAYAKYLQADYVLLRSGGALGKGCGPLLIARGPMTPADLRRARIGIPGEDTTANFLLDFYAPAAQNRSVYLFSDLMPALAAGEVDAAAVIHEGRFVYAAQDFSLIQDLGAYWEAQTGLPIPLGGIVAKRTLGEDVIAEIDRWLRASVEFAWAHPEVVELYVQAHAQELAPEVQQAHIDLYVNAWTLDLGETGEAAVARLMRCVA